MSNQTQYHQLLHHLGPYLPTDRFRAYVRGEDLPKTMEGAVLIADISGYTPLAARLVRELGPQNASEELQKRINPMFEALAGQVFHKGGSVIRFLGDGFIAWFDEEFKQEVPEKINATARATVAAHEMINLMPFFRDMELRVAIGYGKAARWIVGDADYGQVDLMVGQAVNDATHAADPYKDPSVVLSVNALTKITNYPEIDVQILPRGECRVEGIDKRLIDKIRPYRWAPWEVQTDSEKLVNRVGRFVPTTIRHQIEQGLAPYVNELRYVTPMFIQFGGIDYDNDPAAQDKLDDYLTDMQAILAETGGQLISVELSDKGSVAFAVHGAPISYQNDTVRAIQSALKIKLLKQQRDTVRWQSIGISRGLLFAGTVGGEVRHEYTVIGDSTNLAARLMVAASQDQILVSALTRQEANEDFDWLDLTPVMVKGRSIPVEVSEPLRRRYDTRTIRRFGRMVGREKELEQLQASIEMVERGKPQIIRLSGHNGVGKSYTAGEFLSVCTEKGFATYHGSCVSLGRQIAFLPWQTIVHDMLNLRVTWSDSRKIVGLREYLTTNIPRLSARWTLFTELLDIDISTDEKRATNEMERRSKAVGMLIIELIKHQAQDKPVAILIEDTHWLDEMSENILIDLVREVNNNPFGLLILLVHRSLSEEQHPIRILNILQGQPFHYHLILKELDENGVREIVEEQLGCIAPDELVEFLYQKTQGNTFFVQELLNTLQESQAVVVLGKSVFIEQNLNAIDLPQTVLELTQSRIDSLPEAERMVLKVASVIGEQFSFDLLRHSIPLDLTDTELQSLLDELVRREFLQYHTPTDAYRFRHVIVQESTYNGMLSRQRIELHQTVGLALEDIEPTAWEKLALHFGNADDRTKAITYLLKAGDEASEKSANQSAVDYYDQALTRIRNATLRFDTLVSKIRTLFRIGDLDAVVVALDEAREMAINSSSRIEWVAQVGSFYSRYCYMTSAWQEAISEAQTVLDFATPKEDLHLMWHSYEVMRDTHRQLNNWQAVAEITTQMQDIAQKLDDEFRTMQLHLDDLAELHRQFPQRAVQELVQAYPRVRVVNNLWLEGQYWDIMGRIQLREQQYAEALWSYQRLLDIWKQVGNHRLEGHTLNKIGLLLLQLGQLSEGNDHVQWAYRLLRQANEMSGEANSLASLGILAERYEAYDEALAYLRRSHAVFEQINAVPDMARLAFIIGNIFLHKAEYDEARRYFQQAIDISLRLDNLNIYAEYNLGTAHLALLEGNLEVALEAIEPAVEIMLAGMPYNWIDLGLAYWRILGILRVGERQADAEEIYTRFNAFFERVISQLDDERAQRDFINRVRYHQEITSTNGYPRLVKEMNTNKEIDI